MMARIMQNTLNEWVPHIPFSWKMAKLKNLVEIPITDGPHETPAFVDSGIPFASAESVYNEKINLSSIRGYITPELNQRYSLKYFPKRNDILMVKSGSTTGKVALVDFDRIFNVWSPLAAIRCHPLKTIPKFMLYALGSSYFQALVQTFWSFGTQPNIGMGVLGNLPVMVPPLAEQIRIAAYLDDRTTAIDSKIQLLEEKSKGLAELRKSIVHQAVTKGLDPNVAMKPSGVDWIGDMPIGWELIRLKDLITIAKGKKPDLYDTKTESRLAYLSAKVIRGLEESQYAEKNSPQSVSASTSDILMIMDGSSSGEIFTDVEGIVSSTMAVIKHKSKIAKDLLVYVLDGLFADLNTGTIGSAIPHVDKELLHKTCVSLPLYAEQNDIITFLDKRTAVIDESIKTIAEQIMAIKALRQSLIHEAVTGKIDVADYGYNY